MAIFKGSGVAIVTPFNDNGVDFNKLGELLDWHVENGTDAIIICGTTGEAPTMSDDEKKAAYKFTVDKIAGRIPVIAGTGSNDTHHSIELSKYAESVGCNGVLCVTPYYNKTTQKGLIAHYTAIADSINIPVIIYNVPGRTGINTNADTLKALSVHENIGGIKEASGNISQVVEIGMFCDDNFCMYSGNDDQVVPLLSVGGIGVISVVANIAPKLMHDMVDSFLKGDVKTAMKLQLDIKKLNDALFCEVNPIPIKTAMNLLGMNVGKLRLPLVDMSEGNLNRLKNELINSGFELRG
ncbi:MAG TPA: 4-hydroxy-tetrahydrodipicolinate synthase [Bacillota bacterium]|nr:4-hydroxy-tetrahydrodipicolinate synthase [Clostridiaceae bacterium]HPA53600.1 4-hydroxy-tetrahydrodipicolinate synthase [Bacillota bacterium]HPX68107.1 4-hydroxy-tetrahydrodipicolinate synthase [Bacillota bacterium]HQA64483.1 4-hydroxy-tetrahydrodipicolinate synthase [Bacillota bacterium]